MSQTLLAVGDREDWDSYLKFYRQKRALKNHNVEFVTTDYDSILNDNCPDIATDTVVVFLFFPFAHWDRHIEPTRYAGAYGNREFYSKLKTFWRTVDRTIRKRYKNKRLRFVNAPQDIPLERDKEATKKRLSKAGILTPRSYRPRDVGSMLARLDEGKRFFVKPRYGSMGKGITYLAGNEWQTNFGFSKNRLMNRHSDYGWKFRDITGNRAFLEQLLQKDMIIEEAIPRWLIKGKQFDLRCLLFFGDILYMYPRSNVADKVTTNVSQGAQSETMSFLEDIPRSLMKKAERTAVRAAATLGLNFAGVDIMLDPHRRAPVVIELNAFPGFPKVRTFNLGKALMQKIGDRTWK